MKVKLFTHTDLDGVGCGVVAAHAFGKENVDITYCDYDKINEKVVHFLSTTNTYYDLVLITDISVDEVVADIIDCTINNTTYYSDVDKMPRKLILLDHHATAGWLNKYWWANVTPVKLTETRGEEKTSGTSMLFDYCVNHNHLGVLPSFQLFKFQETVRRWDTWDWMNLYGGEKAPKTLNSYLYLIGRERFFNRFADNASLEFDAGEELVLQLEEERITNYISKVSRGVKKLHISGYKVGLVFAEQYISELGNAIANDNPDIDFAVIVNLGGGTVSYRGVKDELDLGDIVIPLDGGGHAKAAGSKIPKDMISAIVALFSITYLGKLKKGENTND